MKRQKPSKKTEETVALRVEKNTFQKVKDYKKASGVAIGKFYDLAAKDRLEKLGIK